MRRFTLHAGDCLDVLDTLDENSIDAVVTDPPYHLTTDKKGGSGVASLNPNSPAGRARISTGFMGKAWDGGDIAFRPDTWAKVLRVLKPGGHLVAFGGTRTYHRLACAVEDAGFEVRDCLLWHYGSGFPKSLDVSKAIDKAAGAEREVVGVSSVTGARKSAFAEVRADSASGVFGEASVNYTTAPATDAAREWQGWGTALKPSTEIAVLARKPLSEGTVAANVLRWGTGALNIDATRIETSESLNGGAYAEKGGRKESQSLHGGTGMNVAGKTAGRDFVQPAGRWPANLAHDGSEEVLAGFPNSNGSGPARELKRSAKPEQDGWGMNKNAADSSALRDAGSGSAARFFYCAKASAKDRIGSKHPTVKPVALMRWLVRLVTPPSGIVLDPFAGTGTTGQAAVEEGFNAILIEREEEYRADILRRMQPLVSEDEIEAPQSGNWLDDFMFGAEEFI